MSASENRLYFLLQLTAHRLKKRADTELKSISGLTTAQAAALAIIAKDGPVSQKQVADTLSQRESAVMTMATRLLNAGFITRRRSRSDARAWELEASKKGLFALSEIEIPLTKLNNLLDACLGDKNMDRFADDLKKILKALAE